MRTNPRLLPGRRSILATAIILLGLFEALLIAKTHAQDRSTQETGTQAQTAERLFATEVLPILKSKCLACHGESPDGELKGKLDLRTREAMMLGGESGEATVVPNKPQQSTLVSAIEWRDWEMPPKENDRLTNRQIAVIRQWIAAGAPWPSAQQIGKYRAEARSAFDSADGIVIKTSGGLGDEWTFRRYQPDDVWAFQPVVKRQLPNDAGSARVRHGSINPIDAFIDARRDAAGFAPAPTADPRTLIRRASFDLTGLPPAPAEVVEFERQWLENSNNAWTTLINRLLESPHYGERWAQHWLDVARYADTGGYSNDYERSNAWRYRDYVVRSFNDDKPYDQFVLEQLAGDELADASLRERLQADPQRLHQARLAGEYNEQESEWIVAAGFLRMGPWDSAMVMPPEARQIYLDDLVNAVGQAFLSTTMRCVKCHDHKFDPIPTRDYYRFYAAFAGTQMAERPVPLLSTENQQGFASGRAFVQQMLDFAVSEKTKLKNKQEAAARAWYAEHGGQYVSEEARKELPDDVKPPRHVGLDHVEQGQLKVREQDEWIWRRRLERYEPFAQAVYNGPDPKYRNARSLRIAAANDPKWRPPSTILLGGALAAPGDAVTPGVLSAVGLAAPLSPADDPYRLPDPLNGRRLNLARWVVDPGNPLTSRSIVNRIWQHHFGQALARNPNNFGAK
ncbi:MAG: DUF1549 domain-containing protein, partial [Planctomycetales bacterium]|nr:DUF1549 domain-containing protein [Planctomycetales bacterium]